MKTFEYLVWLNRNGFKIAATHKSRYLDVVAAGSVDTAAEAAFFVLRSCVCVCVVLHSHSLLKYVSK
jgi:hypothetical protein